MHNNIENFSNNHEISPIERQMLERLAKKELKFLFKQRAKFIDEQNKKHQQNLAIQQAQILLNQQTATIATENKPYSAMPNLFQSSSMLTWHDIHGSDTKQRLENTREKLIIMNLNRHPSI